MPFKGTAHYWSVRVGDRVAENAIWSYPDPLAEASWLAGLAAAYWPRLDEWWEEDEQVFAHVRDPYARIDVRPTSRRVEAVVAGEIVAASRRAMLLWESGLAVRAYLPLEDVERDRLVPSETRTVCPYKGTASHFSLRTGDGLVEDAAWCYERPFDEVGRIAGRVAFYDDKVDVRIGEPGRRFRLGQRRSTPGERGFSAPPPR